MAERQAQTDRIASARQLEAELGTHRSEHMRAPAQDRDPDDLSLCPCCGRDLVYPVDWTPAENRRWKVALRCPECEWHGAGVYGQYAVDRFDEALDDGTQAVLDDLEALTRANMEEQIERFTHALEADLILPEDF